MNNKYIVKIYKNNGLNTQMTMTNYVLPVKLNEGAVKSSMLKGMTHNKNTHKIQSFLTLTKNRRQDK